jgi:hypothetical protein
MYETSCTFPHISVTCSKWYIRKAPFVLGAQPLEWVGCVSAILLNKLASQKLWCPLGLCLRTHTTFLGPAWDLEGGVFTSLSPGGLPLPGAIRLCWSGGGSLFSSKPKRWVPVAQRNLKRCRNQPGSPNHQTGKNLGSNSGLPQKAEGSLINSQKALSNALFVGETMSLRLREQGRSTVLSESVWKCESET